MIMLCLARAVPASAIAVAFIGMMGCDGRGVVNDRGAAYLATASPRDGIADERLSRRAAVPEQEAEHMTGPTPVELRHFSMYKRFRAMFDASSGASGSDERRSGTSGPADAGTGASFTCSSESLIRQDD